MHSSSSSKFPDVSQSEIAGQSGRGRFFAAEHDIEDEGRGR
jgi:hypothetical protein